MSSSNTDTSSSTPGGASTKASKITMSSITNSFNDIMSQTKENQVYDSHFNTNIFSGGFCPYRNQCPYHRQHHMYRHYNCPYYQNKMKLLRQQGLNTNNKKQYFYYPIPVYNGKNNKNIINKRNKVSNAFLNYINNKKNKPERIMNTNNSSKSIYTFKYNGKNYIGTREKYTFNNNKNKNNNGDKKIKYINRIVQLK